MYLALQRPQQLVTNPSAQHLWLSSCRRPMNKVLVRDISDMPVISLAEHIIDLLFATKFYKPTYMIRISQSRKLIQDQNLFTLPIFTVLQSVVHPRSTGPKYNKENCQDRGNFCKIPF